MGAGALLIEGMENRSTELNCSGPVSGQEMALVSSPQGGGGEREE